MELADSQVSFLHGEMCVYPLEPLSRFAGKTSAQ